MYAIAHVCCYRFFLLHGLQLHPKIIPITTYQGTGILLLTYSYLMLALLGSG